MALSCVLLSSLSHGLITDDETPVDPMLAGSEAMVRFVSRPVHGGSDEVFTERRMSRHKFSKAHPEIDLTVRGADAASSELEV